MSEKCTIEASLQDKKDALGLIQKELKYTDYASLIEATFEDKKQMLDYIQKELKNTGHALSIQVNFKDKKQAVDHIQKELTKFLISLERIDRTGMKQTKKILLIKFSIAPSVNPSDEKGKFIKIIAIL